MPVSETVFGPTGRLAAAMPAYELRPEQAAMAAAVERALERGGRLMVEAGTGVGKTFAYLVPLLFLAAPGLRAVVSTGTIALQEQLVRKDLPLLLGILDEPKRFALLKGRSNYICLRRLDLAAGVQEELFELSEERAALREIAREAAAGAASLQDLSRSPPHAVWAAVRAEEGNCGGKACRTRKNCPFRRARSLAAVADLVVVNHALLLADMALREADAAILPEYPVLVVDEAHRLETVAASNLGVAVRSAEVVGYLRTIAPRRRGGWLRSLGAGDSMSEARRALPRILSFFDSLRAFLAERQERTYRVRKPGFMEDTLSPALYGLAGAVAADARAADSDEARVELESIAARVKGLAAGTAVVMEMSGEGHVFWVEAEADGGSVSLNAAPVDVSPVLRERLFAPLRTLVLTSATLSVPGASPFAYFRSRLGLEGGEELILGSPFRYSERVTLVAGGSVPDPGLEEEYLRALAPAVNAHLARCEGGAFVLFTSYKALNRVCDECSPELAARGVLVLRQGGDLSVPAMLEQFRAAGNAVIFGADSFWEGVDVPGPALSLVILTRLPFASPAHPLTEARLEAIAGRGGNPFRELSLPQAILRFKQGFGRLIRTAGDSGSVVVLDSRIANRWYGRLFFEALPECATFVE